MRLTPATRIWICVPVTRPFLRGMLRVLAPDVSAVTEMMVTLLGETPENTHGCHKNTHNQ
jgi:hypothetical protein